MAKIDPRQLELEGLEQELIAPGTRLHERRGKQVEAFLSDPPGREHVRGGDALLRARGAAGGEDLGRVDGLGSTTEFESGEERLVVARDDRT